MLLGMHEADSVHEGLFDKLLEALGLEPVSDEELFQALKNFETLPCIANVFYEMSSSKLYDKLVEIDTSFKERCTWIINSYDTHFMIDGEDITSCDDLENILNPITDKDIVIDCDPF